MLSMQKFSSNVIEKCMDRASEEVIVKYVHELADPAAMRPLLQASLFVSPPPTHLYIPLRIIHMTYSSLYSTS